MSTQEIPYERQSNLMSNRMCGAAALCMVYRSLGIGCSQSELATAIAPKNQPTAGARTYLLAQDALARGLAALVIRVREPLRALRQCQNLPVRLILNHRPGIESPDGHFSVLIGVEGDAVVVHDPSLGPNTRILQSDLVKLWRPLKTTTEITGNVLVALAQDGAAVGPCEQCGGTIPETIPCPTCRKSITLRPASVLGCGNALCPERLWEGIFCPACDFELRAESGKDLRSFTASPSTDSPEPSKSAEPAAIDPDPLKIQVLSEKIDRFLAILLATTGGGSVPGLSESIATVQELQSNILTEHKKDTERRAKAAQSPGVPKPVPAPEPVAPEPEREPVDWNELSRKLLGEMGFVPVKVGDELQVKARPDEVMEYLRKKGLWK